MKLADLRAKNETGMKQRISSAADDRVYEFTVWKAFDKSRTYMASGDTAEGVGGDASVLYIWDVTDLSHISMCAKYDANDVSLVEFAYVCRKILALYGDPPLFAERNGVSAGMLESLRVTYGYQNIATEGKDGDAGIYSHVTIKGRANLWAREMLTTDGFGFEIPDKDLVDEMQTFVKKDTKGHFTVFQAAPGAHDDHMMSFVWGCWALSEEVIQKYFNITGVFKNSFGQQQPAKLAPLSPYSADALNALEKDKAYLDYVSFR